METAGENPGVWDRVPWASICVNPPDARVTGNFSCMAALENIRVPIVVLASFEHWLFVIGIALFAAALIVEKVRGDSSSVPASAPPDSDDQIRMLVELRKAGTLTQAEVEAKAVELVRRL